MAQATVTKKNLYHKRAGDGFGNPSAHPLFCIRTLGLDEAYLAPGRIDEIYHHKKYRAVLFPAGRKNCAITL
jgi:hypothetical protein